MMCWDDQKGYSSKHAGLKASKGFHPGETMINTGLLLGTTAPKSTGFHLSTAIQKRDVPHPHFPFIFNCS